MNLISGIDSPKIIMKPCKNNGVSFGKHNERNLPLNTSSDYFQRQNQPQNRAGFRVINTSSVNYHFKHDRYEYKNILSIPLKAEPNPMLFEELEKLEQKGIIHNSAKANQRISSLSRYLKEEMVGFITPNGNNWFEGACEYIIKGCAGIKLPESEYVKYAKQFWALMSMADKYWLTEDFINYLDDFKKPNPGVEATIRALKELKANQMETGSQISFGYESKLRYIDKILSDGCAYTGERMSLKNLNSSNFPTMEHIFPHVSGGDNVNDDCNYLVVSREANGLRSDIPLLEYLKGWDANEYEEENPGWKKHAKKVIAELTKADRPDILHKQDKKILNRLIFQFKRSKTPEAILKNVPERLRPFFEQKLKEENISLDLTA